MRLTWKDYAEITTDIVMVFVALLFGHWIGFALAVTALALIYGYKGLVLLRTIRGVLLSRLADRCALCHREILDEGGVLERDFEDGELKLYHEACSDKLDAMKQRLL